MHVRFIERVIKLSDMKPGQFAVSRNRQTVFACGNVWNKTAQRNEQVIMNLTDLSSQYSDKTDMGQAVTLISSANAVAIQFSDSVEQ